LGTAQAVFVEPLKKLVDGVLIREVVIFLWLVTWFIFAITSSSVFKLPVPDFFDLVNLVFAELLPAFHLLSL
jgi:hypothetical protein